LYAINIQQYTELINYCQLLINMEFCLKTMLSKCPPLAETQAVGHLRHCFIAVLISC